MQDTLPIDPTRLIATILRHDRRTASYKLALIRGLGDVVLGYPQLADTGAPVAVPLRALASFWIAYYWPFVDPNQPIKQGRHAADKQDISFRPALSELRRQWAELVPNVRAADGFFLSSELQTEHRRRTYPPALVAAYTDAIDAIVHALRQPIRYAGPEGEHTVFPPPQSWRDLARHNPTSIALPGTQPADRCVLVASDLWRGLRDLSLWIEALCIHEWSLFTEQITGLDRGIVYTLLTDRPDNRRPLTWERNQVEILMMEGVQFTCPWTGHHLSAASYDLDHLLPIRIYPINELWNLVPADRDFNQHTKRDRIPGPQRLAVAQPRIAAIYHAYDGSPELGPVLRSGANARFSTPLVSANSSDALAQRAVAFIQAVADARNLPVF